MRSQMYSFDATRLENVAYELVACEMLLAKCCDGRVVIGKRCLRTGCLRNVTFQILLMKCWDANCIMQQLHVELFSES